MLLIDKVLKTIDKFSMLSPGDRVLVGVSGGPDSVALLHILRELAPGFDLELHAFHLNHHLREESADDSRFVARLCERLAVSLDSAEYDVPAYLKETGLSIEDGARRIRYRLIEETASRIEAGKIALGHQADDQVETFLMRLIRGAGLTGLAAIPPVRGRIIRPLIETGKDEILAYLEQAGESYVIDASNEDTSFFRNRVRLRLIPELMAANPDFKKAVLQTNELVRDDESLLDVQSRDVFDRLATIDTRLVVVATGELGDLPTALARRVVRLAVEKVKGDLLSVEFKHVEAVIEGARNRLLRIDLPGDVIAAVEGDELVIAPKDELEPFEIPPTQLLIPGKTDIPSLDRAIVAGIHGGKDYELVRNPAIAELDADRIGGPVICRSWKPGDSFTPLGLKGEKKIQDFFVDEKIARRHRGRVPIVEAAGRVIWVGGMRIDDRVKVRPKSLRVLTLQIIEI